MNPSKPTRKQNDLFANGKSQELNACVGRNGGPYGFDDYARGYFWAGARLADSLKENRQGLDVVIYPVVFVYRQGIELSLKYLAGYLPFLWDEHHDVVLSHKLIDNWRNIRPCIMRCVDLDPENTVPSVDKILADFTEIDPGGEVFRFPESRRGQKHLEETSIINVEVFAQAMATLDEIFDFWFHITSELFDRKMDAQNQAGV